MNTNMIFCYFGMGWILCMLTFVTLLIMYDVLRTFIWLVLIYTVCSKRMTNLNSYLWNHRHPVNEWCVIQMGLAYSFRELLLDATLHIELVHKLILLQDDICSTQRAFCVLQVRKIEPMITVQYVFCKCFGIDLPLPKNIHRYHQLDETGCLCKDKSSGRLHTSDENVQRIQQAFEQSPGKSTRLASRDLTISYLTVRHVLRRCLICKPYWLQLVLALHVVDITKCVEFCNDVLMDMDGNRF